MSHFSVLVIGADVERQLAPYHEFECTGTDDEFVQDIDTTEDERAEFAIATRSMVRLADGTLISSYDDACYRELTEAEDKELGPFRGSGWCGPAGISYTSKDWGDGKGYRTKAHFIPDGAKSVKVPFTSFASYLEWGHHKNFIVPYNRRPDTEDSEHHKYGYALQDEHGEIVKVVRRTNPNKKWDWWTIGGRRSGWLKLKPGASGLTGRKGVMGSCHSDGPGRADQCLKAAVDFDGMRDEAEQEATARWDKACAAKVAAGYAENTTWDTWEHVRDVLHPGHIDAAREAYNAQPVLAAVKKAMDHPFNGVDEYLTSRETFAQLARARAVAPYAMVMDGKWIAKGTMGWFGVSTETTAYAHWLAQVQELLNGLPDDTLLTVVDCHI